MPPGSETEVQLPPRIEWAQHRAWLDHHWLAGQHVSIIAPTGGGKSYLIRHGLLPLWEEYRVLIIDSKGGEDATWAGYGQVVHEFPAAERGGQPPDREQGPRIYRLISPGFEWSPALKRESDGLRRARTVVGSALDLAFRQRDWVIVADETRALTDSVASFGLGLRGLLEMIWQRGRALNVTLVAGTQAPRYVPSSFYDQPSLVYVGRTLDGRAQDRLDEIGGDTRAIQATMRALRRRDFLVVERDSGRMLITQV
jgi:hypothetical protein